ncbi:MAG: FMN-binding protein [Bacillota bacterium]
MQRSEVLRTGLFLMIVCGVAALALAFTATTTQPMIEENRERELQEGLAEVLPGATEFELVEEWESGALYEGKDSGEAVGHVALIERQGYGGPISVLVGIDSSGAVAAPIAILEHTETPGLGSNIENDWFQEQFSGKAADDPFSIGDDLDGLAGATVSSRAVAGAVLDALDRWSDLVGPDEGPRDIAEVPDGVYEGTGRGYGGNIVVEVEVQDGELVDITILDNSETPNIGGPALEEIPEAMIEQQSTEVDAVSGATATSNGVMDAVENALFATGEEPGDESEEEPEEEIEVDLSAVADGVYTGTAEGYGGELSVEVEVSGGELVRVEVLEHDETPEVGGPATEEIPAQMLETGQVGVDAVSGATVTSEAIMRAVADALEGDGEEEIEVDLSAVTDGVYTGTAEGYGGELSVEVEVSGGELVRVEVLEHDETPEVGGPATEEIPAEMLNTGEVGVDAVSGATVTSEAIMRAVADALQ